MEGISHPGHGNSNSSVVGNWTCFNFTSHPRSRLCIGRSCVDLKEMYYLSKCFILQNIILKENPCIKHLFSCKIKVLQYKIIKLHSG